MTTHISLKFVHPKKDLTLISKALGLIASRNWIAGQDRVTVDGEKLSGKYESSYCVFKMSKEIESINTAALYLDNLLKHQVLSEFDDGKLVKTLYCTLENIGEIINPAAMQIFVKLGITLEIE